MLQLLHRSPLGRFALPASLRSELPIRADSSSKSSTAILPARSPFRHRHQRARTIMSQDANCVAVIGAGGTDFGLSVQGCTAAASLAERGVPVQLFEMGRGPGGRLSTRRETTTDGKELLFDHGAQYMTVGYPEVQPLLDRWVAAGLLQIWHPRSGSYNFEEKSYSDETFDDGKPKYVGVPGMNSFCKAMAAHSGVEARYGTKVAEVIWTGASSWLLKGQSGESLGSYGALVVADKALASERFRAQTGLPPPLEAAGVPDLYGSMSCISSVSCFTVMAAFCPPLTSVPYDRFTIESSDLLAGAVRVNSKPGRAVAIPNCEHWVLHSTADFARKIVSKEGFAKPSNSSLESIAGTLLQEFQKIVPEATDPFFLKAHRWGSAFPTKAAAPAEKCLLDSGKRIVACGDFCTSPRIDGAIASGLAAADAIYRFLEILASKF